MKAAVALMLASSIAFGAEPIAFVENHRPVLLVAQADAPKIEVKPDAAFVLKAGELMPIDGVGMSDAAAVAVGKRLAGAEAQVAALDKYTLVSTPVLLAGLGAVLAVIAASATAAYFVGKKDGAAP